MHSACTEPLWFDFVILYNKMSVKQINSIELKDGFNHLFTVKRIAASTWKKCGYPLYSLRLKNLLQIVCRATGNIMSWHSIHTASRAYRKNGARGRTFWYKLFNRKRNMIRHPLNFPFCLFPLLGYFSWPRC